MPTAESTVAPITPKQKWIGSLRGARVATAFISEFPDGSLRLSVGFVGGNEVSLVGAAPDPTGRTPLREITSKADVPPVGELTFESRAPDAWTGSWRIGQAEGVFEFARVELGSQIGELGLAEQPLWNREESVGSVTLYKPDLIRLIAEMESHIPSPRRTLVRAVENGQAILESAERYLGRSDYPTLVREMTITCEEAPRPGFRKILNVVLADDGSTSVSASSPDELWTLASTQQLATYIRQFSSRVTGWLRKHGLNINALILIAILIWMPDRPLAERVVAFIVGIVTMLLIVKSHTLIPTNRVYLDPDQQKQPFARELPAAALAVFAGLTVAFLQAFPDIYRLISVAISSLLSPVGG